MLYNSLNSIEKMGRWVIQKSIYCKKQKQPPWGVHRKRCSENIQQIYRRTPMPKCDFNKVVLQLYWNHTLAWLLSCKFAAYFQNNFLKNASVWLLLKRLFYSVAVPHYRLTLKIHQYAVLLLTKYYYVLLKFFTSLICLWIDLVALLLIVIFAKKQPKLYRHDFDLYSWNDLWVLMSWIQFCQFMEVFINGLI